VVNRFQRLEDRLASELARAIHRKLGGNEFQPSAETAVALAQETAQPPNIVLQQEQPEIPDEIVELIVGERMDRLRRLDHRTSQSSLMSTNQLAPSLLIAIERGANQRDVILGSVGGAHDRSSFRSSRSSARCCERTPLLHPPRG
jgi:hypothetical protein